jgi:salicylate hydroxylase
MQSSDVIVVGAGIGGLAAALGLLRSGQRVRVFEAVSQLGEVGAGLSITPNAGKALVQLGLGERLEAIGSTPPAGSMTHYATGETLVKLEQDRSRERYGQPLYHIHRADLHGALLEAVTALDPQCLQTGRALAALDSRSDAVTARFADGGSAEADWLIGADGVRSTTRAALFGADKPHFTGYVAYRGLVPAGLAPAHLFEPPLNMTVGPRRMIMRYTLRRRTLINFVALAQREAWMEEGWSVPATREELLAEFQDFEPKARSVLELAPADRLFKWGLFDRDAMTTWTRGRTTLLGDAAHAMPPFTGQGAAAALEDAAVLGRCAAAAADPTEAIARYERARLPRVTAGLAMSRARASLYFADDPATMVKALGAGMAELRTLYDYDGGSVPV